MKKFFKDSVAIFLLFLSLELFFAFIETYIVWGDVYIEQILINLDDGASEVDANIIQSYKNMALLGLIATCVLACIIQKNRYLIAISFAIFAFVGWKTGVFSYLVHKNVYSDLFEKEYIDPKDIDYTFADNKRNLIVIYLESMEEDYAHLPKTNKNLIPHISKYMQKELSFKGFHQIRYQDYTIAGMVESMCAIPYKKSTFDVHQSFLDNAVCFPQILHQNGYKTYFMKGASIKFAKTILFIRAHGFESIQGKTELEEEYQIPLKENTGAFSGYRDSTLYEMAKIKLSQIKKDEPFMFAMITLDTHGPDIYLDAQCKKGNNFREDVIMCADQMLSAFLDWIKEQDFYPNTTVVVLGDHPETAKNTLYPNLKNRKIVQFILNPAPNLQTHFHKAYTTLDIAPTILEAVGIKPKDGKFGLGRSLLASAPTLFEKMGLSLETELLKSSKVYDNLSKPAQNKTLSFTPYPSFDLLIDKPQEIATYTSYSNTHFDAVFLNYLAFALKEEKDDLIFETTFKTMLGQNQQRNFDVYINNVFATSWHFSSKDKQPIKKQIIIPANALKNGKLLIDFRAEESFSETLSIGVKSFRIFKKTKN